MKRLLVDDNGPFTGSIFTDGYCMGGRLLEGVDFLAEVKDGIVDMNSVRVAPEAKRYFESLSDSTWWIQMVRKEFETNDEFDVVGGDVVWCESPRQLKTRQKNKKVQKRSLFDILGDVEDYDVS